MATLERNLVNRKWLLERLYAEIIGPDPPDSKQAIVVNEDNSLQFPSWEEFRRPKIQPNGEEILWQDAPIKRYGAGVLFPLGVTEQRQLSEEANSTPEYQPEGDPGQDVRIDEDLEKRVTKDHTKVKTLADDTENYDVTLANAYRPSAMGLSFLADLSLESEGILIEVECATYRKVLANVVSERDPEKSIERELWLRVPGRTWEGKKTVVSFTTKELLDVKGKIERWVPGFEERKLQLVIVSRHYNSDIALKQRLLTVSLVNKRKKDEGRIDELCFFQCGLRVKGVMNGEWIISYPEARRSKRRVDDEEEIIRLLYRDRLTFAIGHGCSADWRGKNPNNSRPSLACEVWTDCLPTFETPETSADLKDTDDAPIRVSMRKLARLDPSDDGSAEIQRLIEAYRQWIINLEDPDQPKELVRNVQRPPIPDDLKDTALVLIHRCRECLQRIEDGIDFLQADTQISKNARIAFELANEAMLIAQLRASREVRIPRWDHDQGRIVWDKDIVNIDPARENPTKGYWRAFQIAFLLMSIRGVCEPQHVERRLVDLIWFPTGGGKTEAYLGLTAFTIFYNRLARLEPGGADVIMRYTLRLLTAQQFQRAALLFCSMEHVRRKHNDLLGEKEFRVGMWVGGDATPNSRNNALSALRKLQREPQHAENPFILLKCPWCNSKFGVVVNNQIEGGRHDRGGRRGYHQLSPKTVYGYTEIFLKRRSAKTVVFQCDDPSCEYGNKPLPIVVIDEDIYENPPNLIIGTVDKFAMLAWNPDIRRLFGIGGDGCHTGLPPTLIIQDELHLISGPLGSMVGLYETVIEEVCSQRDDNSVTHAPKIVASTATISRAEDQVKALYARDKVALFPPSGLEAGDSFFARDARNDDGSLKPGRLYSGLMAPALGSLQTTEARVFATLFQYPAIMPVIDEDESERDPWWTLIIFFNSLRELGGAATLLVADTRDYLRVILDRHGFSYKQIRQLLNWEELTSRVRTDQIPLSIQKLEIPFQRDSRGFVKDTLEACLASSIIEVGIDIDRLSLISIIGQPKTTSQYIQVSSRIGRSHNAPGLSITLYSQGKPRDRSHYERFRSYHQRLYAQVEPTSVTPFSPPAVDRALHAIIVAAVRQLSPLYVAESPRPNPLSSGSTLLKLIERMIVERVTLVDPSERVYVRNKMCQRFTEWQAWDPEEYGTFGAPPPNPPLMHPAGSRILIEWKGHSWPTLSSLRNVDATCEAEVTTAYNEPVIQEVIT